MVIGVLVQVQLGSLDMRSIDQGVYMSVASVWFGQCLAQLPKDINFCEPVLMCT